MKKIILVITIFQFWLNLAIPQWIQQYPNTTGIGFHDIKFINKNTGWVCGDGIILKTTNAGTNWVAQSHPATGKYLYSLSPVDSLNVFCVGYFETVLKTTNGGDNWIALRNGPWGQGHSYQGTFFLNKYTGWVCGSLGTILKTTNGGDTFDSSFISTSGKDMYFLNADTGLLCSGFGGIYKTTNSGLNWDRKHIPYGNGIGDFRKLSVINNQFVFVAEDGNRVFRSTNFGDSWDSIGYVAGADQPYVCRFSSLMTGWVGGTWGEIYKSTDSGGTWRRENTGSDTRYTGAMWFPSDSVGWAVGGNTKLIYTTSGGLTFIESNSNENPSNIQLFQNYPNPFNPTTVISYSIINNSFVSLKIFDVLGNEIATLVNEKQNTGSYNYTFSIINFQLSSGIYFYKLIAGDYTETKSMMLLK